MLGTRSQSRCTERAVRLRQLDSAPRLAGNSGTRASPFQHAAAQRDEEFLDVLARFCGRLPEDGESLRRRKRLRTSRGHGARSASREIELAPAEADDDPPLPHHPELRVPAGHVREALGIRRVVAHDRAGRASIVHGRVERPEPLLPRRVPDLQVHACRVSGFVAFTEFYKPLRNARLCLVVSTPGARFLRPRRCSW